MNNIYNTANKLAKEIQESSEYKNYKKAREAVLSNPELKKKIEDFEQIRYDVQVLSMEKGKEDPEKMQKLQEMYAILVENKDIKDYFDLEVKFNVMVADINKIIAESMSDIFKHYTNVFGDMMQWETMQQ